MRDTLTLEGKAHVSSYVQAEESRVPLKGLYGLEHMVHRFQGGSLNRKLCLCVPCISIA